MIPNSIRLADALQQMEEADTGFTLRFIQADRKRNKAGAIVEWHQCRLSRPRQGRPKAPGTAADPAPRASRQPNHHANATRNLVRGRSTQVRKVHIWLILAFNGKKVVLS